ncbi:DUF1446 domain-containing protein [Mesorhizobium sp. CU2]|uniref:acyclic terpene utilization AtuA family protein n=1 Tax=unclassified Mesorhizobium TaxID=325217 RepID=UPI00112B1284|nr:MULTISPECIES: acyclic terpene utilization AtuA family protein [unclassified Mesorhizobium]TPN85586.1 DUF1446 domain-containing protein [Mesorhizobium sp. CU3]TPO02651.1 DUF1446 domain-containing protein [Mesorhizobium sp. CU2]
MNNFVRVGSGAGMADDRIAPAQAIAERGGLDYLVMECLAERTIARETLDRSKDPSRGYTPSLRQRIRAVLPACRANGTRIVTNMGAANPRSAAAVIAEEAQALGLATPFSAVVLGDDVAELVRGEGGLATLEDGLPLEEILPRMASANAYLGADAVRDALGTGAEIVVTGRVADPSLFLGPMLHHFGWSYDDLDRLAAGTVAGHLLECSGQLTGGCFADPGRKEVEDLAGLGYPFADVSMDGRVTLSKTPQSGGRIDRATCTEQLLYEIHDPSRYITPDCVLDITGVDFVQRGKDRVEVVGAAARARTDSYKVVVGYFDGYIGIGEMGFAGINAVARARLGAEVVKERLSRLGFVYPEMRVDLIGMSSLHGDAASRPEPYEVRLRIAARSNDRTAAAAVGAEVRGLHMQGPAGAGGGYSLGVQEVLAVKSVLLPRNRVTHRVETIGHAH